jgi:DNA topoisomerase-1
LRLQFRGKSGVLHDITVQDPRMARLVRRCQDLPGQDLFQYVDEAGNVRRIGSADVNRHLAEASGYGFTAKDFRTWHASAQALELTRLACEADSESFDAKAALAEVARRLRNTPAVCRSSYIHPAILALWQALNASEPQVAATRRQLAALRPRKQLAGLQMHEQRLLLFLRRLTSPGGRSAG